MQEPDHGSVTCPSCDHRNRDGAHFCGACGTPLDLPERCPACGSANPGGQRFCDECGAEFQPHPGRIVRPAPVSVEPPEHLTRKIRDHGARLAGERKQVTVLFADVTGSMDLAEQTDPERWREIMNELFQQLAHAVHRFEGTVDKFTGDGIMALFGAPLAHEDHAQRACFAALEMRRAIAELAAELRRTEGISLSLRIGLNSGEVVVGAIGDDLSLEYTAIGHTVGLAQRMETLAEPGTAYLTEHTARLAAGYADLEDLGEFAIKGSSRPMRVFALRSAGSARGRLDVARGRGLTRFVGRAAEMAELESAVERALAGEGAVVGVVAEAGVGKSRLCHELAELCRARGMTVYEAQCQAHTRDLPLLPVLQMMRTYFGIEIGDSDRAAREKIAGRLLLLDPALAEELGLVFDFLAVPDPQRPAPQMNPEARLRRLLGIVGRLVTARGRDDAVVSLVEDLHWIDSSSEAFISALVAAVPGTRTLVVTNFRPEYRGDWTSRSYYRQIPLVPLGPEALAELLTELLGDDPSLDGLADMIRDHTRGNPFYVEEVVRELEESGSLEGERGAYRLVQEVDGLTIPPTVQAILAARIDRLDAAAKAVLQAASAIGTNFEHGLLAEIVDVEAGALDTALADLVESELVYQSELYPEPKYEFRHPLTREVAYGSQLAPARAGIHAAIARGLQGREPERLDERAPLIAQHFEAAGEPLEAARWHARAAEWAGFRDPAAAHRHWQRVRELDAEMPTGAEADGLRLGARVMTLSTGWRLGADIGDMRAAFEEGRAIAERTGNRAALALLHGVLAITIGLCVGDIREWVRLSDEAHRIADGIDDAGVRLALVTARVYPRWLAGTYGESLEAAERALELTADEPHLGAGLAVGNPRAWTMAFRALPLMSLGRVDEARRTLEEGIELCRRWDRESLGWAHQVACIIAVWGADDVGADTLAHARQAVEIAETMGDAFSRAGAATWLGAVQAMLGEADEAERSFGRAADLIEGHYAGHTFEATIRRFRAQALADAGEVDAAVAEVEEALRLVEEAGIRVQSPAARYRLAESLIRRAAPGDAERAEALLAEAETTAREIGSALDAVGIARVRGHLLRLRGDEDASRRSLRQALELARGLDARGLIHQLEAEAEDDQRSAVAR